MEVAIPRRQLSQRAICIALFLMLLGTYGYARQQNGPNQTSRLAALHAIVLEGHASIDSYEKMTVDKAFYKGHYYSEKAPGIVLLALPAYMAGKVPTFVCVKIGLCTQTAWNVIAWFATTGSVGLVTAFGGVFFYVLACNFAPRRWAFLSTIALFLGSGMFSYATMLFSHAASASLLLISLALVLDTGKKKKKNNFRVPARLREFLTAFFIGSVGCLAILLPLPWQLLSAIVFAALYFALYFFIPEAVSLKFRKYAAWLVDPTVLAGAAAGYAVISEYPTALIGLALAALALGQGWKKLMLFVAGAALPLFVFLCFNIYAFGVPFMVGYAYSAWPIPAEMPSSFYGFRLPSLTSAWILLFSPARGLFFWSPFLLLAVAGVRDVYRINKSLCIGFLITFVVYVTFISCHLQPDGGAALGPRHLTPIVPILGIFAACGFRRFPWLGSILMTLSLLLTGIATLVSAMAPERISYPLNQYYIPVLMSGKIAPNLGLTAGLPAVLSILFPVVVLLLIGGWIAGHLPSDQTQE